MTICVAMHEPQLKLAWQIFAPLPLHPVVEMSPGVHERLAVSVHSCPLFALLKPPDHCVTSVFVHCAL